MKGYPKYKASGVPWLGEVPEHWFEKRAKYFFIEIDERSETGDEEMLSVSHITGVTPRSQKNVNMFQSESNVGQKICSPGDLVINTMWAWMSALGMSNHSGIVSPSYGVYRLIKKEEFNQGYLDRLLRIESYRSEYICRSTGIRSSRLRLYPDKFLSMPLLCPPIKEQNQIARYLDWQTAKINSFIRNKKRLIALLREQRQNVINRAVTRGIDPAVKLKESGVEWLGEIPEHWEVLPLKRYVKTKVADGPHTTPNFVDSGIPFVSAEASFEGKIHFTRKRGYITEKDHLEYCKKVKPQRDDIFIVKSGSTTGKACIVDFDDEFSIWSPLALVRCKQNIVPKMMFHAVCSDYFQKQVQDRWSFGTQPNIGMGVLENLKVALPNILEEQQQIVDHIEKETSIIDRTISRTEREIELIEEYRTRLISDVVTGRVDVRHIEVPDFEPVELESGEAEDDEQVEEIEKELEE